MKRIMPSGLITFLQATANKNIIKADCFVITLPTGAVIYVTDGQWDITFKTSTPGWSGSQVTFKSQQYGVWTRGSITSEAGFKLNSGTMTLTCIPQQGTAFPGLSIGMAQAAFNGLFDAATVFVYTAYMPLGGYGDVSNGIETKFQGTVTLAPVVARNKIQFTCGDPLYSLNLKVPSRLLQSTCPWSFCDANCTLDPSDYTVSFTTTSASTQTSLSPSSAFTQADGYFSQGVVKCITGANAGLSATVKVHASGVLQVMTAWFLPIAAGDTFEVIKGCDKTLGMCDTTVKANGTTINNSLNHGAVPFVPVPNTAT